MTAPTNETQARRRAYAEAALAGGGAAGRALAELVVQLLDEAAETWENGFASGVAEGRKAASTQAMLEGSVFRVFDPRKLTALVEDVARTWPVADESLHRLNGERLHMEARRILTDAGVELPPHPTNPHPIP